MQPSEEIKSRLDIVDVIREYIPLKAAGMNFRANCPFHREKTPSFMVSPDKQIWHCFGCGKGGDLFSFITEIEGISFVEALRMLAPKAGVTLQKQDPKLTSERNKILDIIDLSRKYFHHLLRTSPEAQAAREYLKKRGLKDETIEEWQIGYSLDSWDSLFKVLVSRGYKENEIFLAGMIVKKEGAGRFYDRFRDRIMFPITDINSNTVAFSARINPEKEAVEKMGKYINSPQTMVYDKSKILFGLDKAKLEIKKHDLAIVVEGQMDVITAHQAGFKNVVASSGTALTSEQVMLLKRFTTNINLAFDQDQAGQLAADRGIREAMQAEMNIKVVEVPNGKDPDECIKNSPEDWERSVKKAKPMMQYFFDKTFSGLDLDDPGNRQKAKLSILPMVSKLGSKVEQDFWIKKFSERLQATEASVREEMNKYALKPEAYRTEPVSVKPLAAENPRAGREEKLSELLLSLIFKFSSLIEYVANNVQVDQIVGQRNQSIYRSLIFYYNNIINQDFSESPKTVDYSGFKAWLNQEIGAETGDQLKNLDKLVILGDEEFYHLEMEEAQKQAVAIRRELSRFYFKTRMREIEKMIHEQEGDKTTAPEEKRGMINGLMEEFKFLADEYRRIE